MPTEPATIPVRGVMGRLIAEMPLMNSIAVSNMLELVYWPVMHISSQVVFSEFMLVA